MSNGVIVQPLPITAAMLRTSTGTDPAFPATNLLDPQPKVIWRTTTYGDFAHYIDFGVDTAFDTVALLYANSSAHATIRITGATSAEGNGDGTSDLSHLLAAQAGARPPARSAASRFHVVRSVGPQVMRYLKVFVNDDATNPDGRLSAGILLVGQSWQCANPQFNFELGAGRKVVDLSDKRQLPGGENGRWAKAKVPAFRATWSNMEDADLRALWAILIAVGNTEPLLVIEDPDTTAGLNERIHYCTIDSLDYYQRVQVDKSSIELKVTDWL